MKETPLLFSPEMVRAILDGCKTQTRRVIRLKSRKACPFCEGETGYEWIETGGDLSGRDYSRPCRCITANRPYGVPGDGLWVREAWTYKNWQDAEYALAGCPDARTHPTETYLETPTRAIYRASCVLRDAEVGRWHPSIHMPRWASRITLEITKIRVERVQDISNEDAIAEGVIEETETLFRWPGMLAARRNARIAFSMGWDSLNAKRGHGWSENPWVWAITFRRIEGE